MAFLGLDATAWLQVFITACVVAALFIPLEWIGIYTFVKWLFKIDPLAKQKGKEGLYWSMNNYNQYGRNMGGFEVSIDEIVGKASSTKTELERDMLRKERDTLKTELDLMKADEKQVKERKKRAKFKG